MNKDNDTPAKPRLVEEQGATEDQMQKIDAIAGDEVLGYEGSGREEHSGQKSPRGTEKLRDVLANNRPEEMG